MKRKRLQKLGVVLIIIFIICTGVFLFYKYYVIQNTFDQMYYTRIRYHYDWFGGNRSTLFDNMKQLEGITRDGELAATQEGAFSNDYVPEYLPENGWLYICVDKNKRFVSFTYRITFDETNEIPYEEYIWLSYRYHLTTRELEKKSVRLESERYPPEEDVRSTDNKEQISEFLETRDMTWEEIEEIYDWYFYDVFLTDWFEANVKHTRFSLDNLGKYTMVYENDET